MNKPTIKLVQNKKVVKLSREKNTVKAALQRALDDSHRESWKKVLILGEAENGGYRLRHTQEKDITLLGLFEIGKGMITNV